MSVTRADTQKWNTELESMIGGAASEEEAAALSALHGQLSPFFDRPETFRTMLSKIQRTMMSADIEEELTSSTFNNIQEIEALLPEGVKVTTV